MSVCVGKRFLLVPVLLFLCFLVLPSVHAADISKDPGSTVGMIQAGVDGFISDALNDKSRMNSHYTDFMGRGDRYLSMGEYDKAFEEYNGALRYLNDHEDSMSPTVKNQRMALVYNRASMVYFQRGEPGDKIKGQEATQTANQYSEQASATGGVCLITTVFNRTALASSVQDVRDFRDKTIMKSYAGSRFMKGFNAWYYSFSPAASVKIDERPRIKSALQITLAPTIGIVLVSQYLYSLLAFNPDIAAISTFIAGGALCGLLYFFPIAFLILVLAGRAGIKIPSVSVMRNMFVIWAAVLGMLVVAVLGTMDTLTVISSGLLVVCSVILASGTASLSLAGYILRKPGEDTRLLYFARGKRVYQEIIQKNNPNSAGGGNSTK